MLDEPPPPPEGAREAGAVVEPEHDAFMELAVLAARLAEPHKPVQRSHEHTLIARSAKSKKKDQADIKQEKENTSVFKLSLPWLPFLTLAAPQAQRDLLRAVCSHTMMSP